MAGVFILDAGRRKKSFRDGLPRGQSRGEIRELIAIAANELAILERSLPWDDDKQH